MLAFHLNDNDINTDNKFMLRILDIFDESCNFSRTRCGAKDYQGRTVYPGRLIYNAGAQDHWTRPMGQDAVEGQG